MTQAKDKIGIIGLGYVGLPLFCLFSRKYECWGMDCNEFRIKELQTGEDLRRCQDDNDLSLALLKSRITANWNDLSQCNIYIVAVPTPVDKDKEPDFRPLKNACIKIGSILSKNDIVIFESTVHPGTTDEICIPFLEKTSGLTVNNDFFVAYSPERINIGD